MAVSLVEDSHVRHGEAQCLGNRFRVPSARFRKQYGEFLAAITRNEVAGPFQTGFERARDALDAFVAGRMAIGVVERLELVDVDEEQG